MFVCKFVRIAINVWTGGIDIRNSETQRLGDSAIQKFRQLTDSTLEAVIGSVRNARPYDRCDHVLR